MATSRRDINFFSNRLMSAGIRTVNDNTFVIDEPKLERALEVNAEETLRVFTDEKSGILPLLSEKLKNLLRENLGGLDQKKDKILIRSKSHNLLIEKVNKFTEVSRLNNVVKNAREYAVIVMPPTVSCKSFSSS